MLDKILAAAEAHFEDHVTRLQRFIRQPSVSAESRGNDEMAAMLAEEISCSRRQSGNRAGRGFSDRVRPDRFRSAANCPDPQHVRYYPGN